VLYTVSKKLPDEIRRTFIAMSLILKKAWDAVNTTKDERTRLNALALINQVMASRMQLLGDVNVVDKVINLVTDIKQKQQKTEDTQQTEEDVEDEVNVTEDDDDITTKEIADTNE
jgi:hypothetical protein